MPSRIARISETYRETLLEETNRAYAALRANSEQWAEELAQRAAWEATLGDGLDEE